MDMTPNTAMALDVIDPPTLNVSIVASDPQLPAEIWSDDCFASFTQDQLPIVWPHFHTFEMNFDERQILHKALKASVKFVGVGSLL